MAILTTLLIALLVLVCLLMVLIILMQRPKQEGLGAAFGGGMTDSMFGAQTTDVLQKGTTWLAVLFFSTTIALASIKTHEYQAEADKGEGLISNDPAAVTPGPGLQPSMPDLNQPAFDPSIPLPGGDGAATVPETDAETPAAIELLPPPSIIEEGGDKPATVEDESKIDAVAPAADDSAKKKNDGAKPKPAVEAGKPASAPAVPAAAPAAAE